MPSILAPRPRPARSPAVYALIAGGLIAAGVVVDLATYGPRHRGVVLPGVEAGGVELGGLTEDEARDRLRAVMGSPEGRLVVRDPNDGREWHYAPEELGLAPAPETAAAAAIAVGRSGRPLADFFRAQVARWRGVEVQADRSFEEARARQALEALAPDVDVAPRDARIEEGADGVAAIPAEPGRQLDIEAMLGVLEERAGSLDTAVIDLALLNTSPRVFDLSNVEAAYDLATSGPISLSWRLLRFTADAADVAAWFRVEEVEMEDGRRVPSIVVDRDAIRAWLADVAAEVDRPPTSARFEVRQNEVVLLSPAAVGGVLDVEASIDRAIGAAYTDVRVGELAVQEIRPGAGTAAIVDLQGVLPLVEAYVGIEGVPPGMLANLTAAAKRLHGVALARGRTFSFLGELGDPADLEGVDPSILGLPADGIGHVATAAFRAAAMAGLPIVERHPPATRVGWYEPPLGLDAAVRFGDADLRFTNDTGDWLLFEVGVDERRMAVTWTVHAVAPPERRVRLVGPSVSLVTPPPEGLAEIRQAPGVPPAAAVQASWAREGALVVVERVVSTSEGERRDRWVSEYAPAGDLILIGETP